MQKKEYNVMELEEVEVKLALYMRDFMSAFYQERGLQYLIDTAGTIFGRPMLLHDTSFRVMACTSDAGHIIQLIQDENGECYINEETIQYIRNRAIMEKVRKGNSANYIEKEKPHYGTLLTSIKINEIEVGQLAVYEAGLPFGNLDYRLLDEFGHLLSLEIQRSNWLSPHRHGMPNYILEDILEGRHYNMEEEMVLSHLSYLPWVHKKPYHMMMISNKSFEILDSKIPFALQALKRWIPIKNCMVYQSELIVFTDSGLYHKLLEEERSEFALFLKENGLSAGVSLAFTELRKAKKYHFLAQRALDIGRRQGQALSFFEDCGFLIIAELISTQYDMGDFCHPAVLQLMEYDWQNKTEYIQTLKHYIYYTNAPNTAAEILCIHRNTLFYRIHKIKEITGLLLNNADEIYLVYLSIKLLEVNPHANP